MDEEPSATGFPRGRVDREEVLSGVSEAIAGYFDAEPKPPSMDRVLQLALTSILMPFDNFSEFVRIVCVPFFLITALGWIVRGQIIPTPNSAATLRDWSWLMFAWFFLRLAVLTPFNVGWFRLALLGKGAAADRLLFEFHRRELRVLISCLIILAACFAPFALVATACHQLSRELGRANTLLIDTFVATPLGIAGAAFSIRLSLILPEIAIDRFSGVAEFYERTRGWGWRLYCLVGLALLPYIIADSLLRPLYAESDGLAAVAVGIGLFAVGYISISTFAGAIALAYRERSQTRAA